jgi:hypothetical protein
MILIDSSCWIDYYRPGGNVQIQAAVTEAIEPKDPAFPQPIW